LETELGATWNKNFRTTTTFSATMKMTVREKEISDQRATMAEITEILEATVDMAGTRQMAVDLVLLVVILEAMAITIPHNQNVKRDPLGLICRLIGSLGLICSETTMSGLEPR